MAGHGGQQSGALQQTGVQVYQGGHGFGWAATKSAFGGDAKVVDVKARRGDAFHRAVNAIGVMDQA